LAQQQQKPAVVLMIQLVMCVAKALAIHKIYDNCRNWL
jgi:hypothetical protein